MTQQLSSSKKDEAQCNAADAADEHATVHSDSERLRSATGTHLQAQHSSSSSSSKSDEAQRKAADAPDEHATVHK
jgi:hypothetical protein